MKNFFASVLAALGLNAASVGSQACWMVVWDEEECPKSLIK